MNNPRLITPLITITRLRQQLADLRRERDELAARLEEIERQAPVAWVPIHPRTGPLWSMTTGSPDPERLPHYPLMPLYNCREIAPAASPPESAGFKQHL